MFFFPVTLYEIDSWALKKQARNSTDTLELYIGEDFWEHHGQSRKQKNGLWNK